MQGSAPAPPRAGRSPGSRLRARAPGWRPRARDLPAAAAAIAGRGAAGCVLEQRAGEVPHRRVRRVLRPDDDGTVRGRGLREVDAEPVGARCDHHLVAGLRRLDLRERAGGRDRHGGGASGEGEGERQEAGEPADRWHAGERGRTHGGSTATSSLFSGSMGDLLPKARVGRRRQRAGDQEGRSDGVRRRGLRAGGPVHREHDGSHPSAVLPARRIDARHPPSDPCG
jgi:hypothetical protein